MRALQLLVLFLYYITNTNGNCVTFECSLVNLNIRGTDCSKPEGSELNTCQKISLILSNSIVNVKTSPESDFNMLTKLDISGNKLRNLPENFLSNAKELQDLNLGHNMLESLPMTFLKNSPKLKVLRLEGNSLTSIPSAIFQPQLLNLTVDCDCYMARPVMNGILQRCPNVTDCPDYSFKCKLESGWSDVEDFYQEKCGMTNLLAVYIVVPIVILALVAGGVIYYLKQKNKNTADFENKGTADKSPAHVQPHYITRKVETAPTVLNQSRGLGQDYENVFIGHMQTEQPKPFHYLDGKQKQAANSNPMTEEDIYLESDVHEGDQPIYNNTQGVYYSYTKPGPIIKEEEDVYIVPDQ
ncbi:hypothetical protein FKM82_015176 [Ascaphus truei]